VPVAPALGGKLNTTSATLRSARCERRSATSRPTRAASMSARSGQLNMSWPDSADASFEAGAWKVQARSQPVQATCAALPRPPNTIEPVAPSSSGIATIIVASTGSRPRSEPPHWSRLWNSTGVTAT
jgi:hypothetical protein